MRKLTGIFIIISFFTASYGQEYLVGLNQLILQEETAYNAIDALKGSQEEGFLALPFYDDFSGKGSMPDTLLWTDAYAYINSHYGKHAPTLNVATLDVMNEHGMVYSHASSFPFKADFLSSKPIRLDSIFDEGLGIMRPLIPADSIYFSFYYQPQGYGDIPSSMDSLVLQFGTYTGDSVFSHYDSVMALGSQYLTDENAFLLPGQILPSICDPDILFELIDTLFYYSTIMVPCDSVYEMVTSWSSIWSAEGDTLDDFILNEGSYFKYIHLVVDDTAWLKPNFRFRFLNYGSISDIPSWAGNTDHWNLAQVYLNAGRSFNDRLFDGVIFSRNAQSFISPYTAMPIRHFAPYYMNNGIPVWINNLGEEALNINYQYQVVDEDANIVFEDNYSLSAISFWDLTGVEPEPIVSINPVNYFYTTGNDSVSYTIIHSLEDAITGEIKDTILFEQKFYNYFAYDDGTAEAGYVIVPSGSKAALQFELEYPDTLRGVQIYFNHVLNDENDRSFTFVVWNDYNGEPGNVVGVVENLKPKFNVNNPNEFISFIFPDTSVIALGADVFYVGWIQNSNYGLNMGFDKNTDHRERLFYNVDGSWRQSVFEGSLMIRPMVGDPLAEATAPEKKTSEEITVYPNPVSINQSASILLPPSLMELEDITSLNVRIFNLTGQIVYQGIFTSNISIADFEPGLYIYTVLNPNTRKTYAVKMMVR